MSITSRAALSCFTSPERRVRTPSRCPCGNEYQQPRRGRRVDKCPECRMQKNTDARANAQLRRLEAKLDERGRPKEVARPVASAQEVLAYCSVPGTLSYVSPAGGAWVMRDGEQVDGRTLGEAVAIALRLPLRP